MPQLSKRGVKPPKLAKGDTLSTIIDELKEGATYEYAAAQAGMSRKTLQRYKQKGREIQRALHDEDHDLDNNPITPHDDLYLEFIRKHDEAMAEIENTLLQDIQGDESWQSSAWILERRPEFGGKYMKDHVVRHTGHDGGPIKFTMDLGDEPEPIDMEEDDDGVFVAELEGMVD